jgi:uncharacterized protein YukE
MHDRAHTDLAKMLDQLSQNARGCLMTGIKFQDVMDKWNTAVQERNYAYSQRGQS